jgi:hypothetical protein
MELSELVLFKERSAGIVREFSGFEKGFCILEIRTGIDIECQPRFMEQELQLILWFGYDITPKDVHAGRARIYSRNYFMILYTPPTGFYKN